MKFTKLILLYLLLLFYKNSCFSKNYLSIYTISPESMFKENDIGYGIINSNSLNTKITNNKEFHNIMTNPDNSNFFGGLFYSIKHFILTNDESFRPLIVLQTLGGGADISGAIIQGMLILDIVKNNKEISKLYKEKFNENITDVGLKKNKIMEFTYIGCPEKRISHEGVYTIDGYKTKAPHHAFVNGSLDINAGLMPEEIENSETVKIKNQDGTEKILKLFHKITKKFQFIKKTLNPDNTNETIYIKGDSEEEFKMIKHCKATLDMDIFLLSLSGKITDASIELHDFLLHKTSYTPSGVKITSDTGRKLRPCFIWAPDTGGDTFSKRDEFSTKNLIISPVNEAYNLLVIANLLFSNNSLELCINFTPFAWGTDGESTANVINKTLKELHKRKIIEGAVYRISPQIIQYVLVNIFGITKNTIPDLQSHANVKALKLLWKSSIFHDLCLRNRIPNSLNEFMNNLPPLLDIGQMNRYDVPVIDVETIIAPSGDTGAHELMTILNGYKAIKYFFEINLIKYDSIKEMTYLDLRNYLEKHHLVTGENQLPSYTEYELMKAIVLRNASLSTIACEELKAEFLIPRWSNGERFKSCKVKSADIKDTIINLGHFEENIEEESNLILFGNKETGKDFITLRKDLVMKYLKDIISGNKLTTGFLRINSKYILAYFEKDFPLVYSELTKFNMVHKISAIIYEEIALELIDIIYNTKMNSSDPLFLDSLTDKIINEEELITENEKIVAAALEILRINPKANRFFFENLQKLYSKKLPIMTTIVEIQKNIVIGYINKVINIFTNEKTIKFDILNIESNNFKETIELFQNYCKHIGSNSGKYEKLYKNLANLIMLSLETTVSHHRHYAKTHLEKANYIQNRISTLYKSITLFYYILPENLNVTPNIDIFNQLNDITPFERIREGLYAVRKIIRGEGFINLFNGMAYKQLIQYQDMRTDLLNIRDLNLLTALFICTSRPEHISYFQKPIISFLAPEILKGINTNFDNRIIALREEIYKLKKLRYELEQLIKKDEDSYIRAKNIGNVLKNIMNNNTILTIEFSKMIHKGLLAGLSTINDLDATISSLEKQKEELEKNYTASISLMPYDDYHKIFELSA